MLSLRTTRIGFRYPVLITAATAAFLLRGREIAGGTSPGSGVTIAGVEMISRISALVQFFVSTGERAVSLLLRVAVAPVHFAFATLQSEFAFAFGAVGSLESVLHSASLYLLHMV
jgi:hypothetical protein